MREVDIHGARLHLSRLVDAAATGEPFVIAMAGKTMVKVVPIDEVKAKRRVGFMEGELDVPDEFDRLCEDEIARLIRRRRGLRLGPRR